MSFFSFTKKIKISLPTKVEKDSYSLVFNIGSGNIAATVVKFTEKPGVSVLSFAEEAIPFQEELNPARHLDLAKTAITSLVAKIQAGNKNSIKNIFYIFSSPWCISQTKTIRVRESKPFKITEEYLNKLIANQEKQTLDIKEHGKIIESKIIQMKVNGYVVSEIVGKQVRELEISLLITAVPEEILSAIEGVVSKSFIVKNVYCHSSTLAIFSVIRDLFPNYEDFVFVDVSHEMTDISLVKSGVIFSTISFPFGRNHCMRELAEKLKVTPILADSMIKMHNTKSNDAMASLKFTTAMQAIVRDWIAKVSETFDQFVEQLYIPEKIFFVATCDLAGDLSGELKAKNFEVITLEAKKINTPTKIDDTMFKVTLTFLDKIYKI
jgi:cell division ATPase FtsA